MKYLRLHRLLSGKNYRDASNATIKRLVSKCDTRTAQRLLTMHDSADLNFIEWAVNAVVNCKPPKDLREDTVHIHRATDSHFPFSNIHHAIPINAARTL